MKKSIVCILLLVIISLGAQEARAVDILEIRIKRLYKDAQLAADRGDYDEAIQNYNKAIGYAKDKDIKQFLINARKELQRKRREERGKIEPPLPAATKEKIEAPWEMERKIEAEERDRTLKLEEEKAELEAEREKLEEERAKLEEEKRRRESIRQAEIEKERAGRAAEEKSRLEEEKTELEEEEARPILLEEESEEEEGLVDLEERKEREAKDRAIYESSSYRHQVKEILASVKNKLKEASVRMEEADLLKRIDAKVNKLTELDQKAEAYMSQGEYEKAKAVYEQILSMSKDPDLKEYIKRQKAGE